MSISRRSFLRGAAGALALPLLQLPPRRAGAAGKYPKRLLLVTTPNGTLKELWSPQGGTETSFDLPPLLRPMAAFRDKLVIVDGVDLAVGMMGPGGPHQRGCGSLFTGDILTEGEFMDGDGRRAGWASSISVDQFAARQLRPNTRFQTLELGVCVKENEPRSRYVYRGREQPVPPEVDPVASYRRAFAGMDMSQDELQKQLRRRQSVLDSVWADFGALERKVAAPDRAKLQQHATSLRDLELRLEQLVAMPSTCAPLPTPAVMAHMEEDNFEQVGKLQMDLLVMALACDLTRVASLQWASAVNTVRFTFLGINDYDGHGLSHGGDSNDAMQASWIRMLDFYSRQFAYLLERMSQVEEDEGTLLDNTLVVWGNELSRGNSHALTDIPWLLAGGAGGALRGGRHLTYQGAPHNDLLVSILNAVGVATDTFGNREVCTGPLAGLLG